jgi:hypothetical protein
MCLFTATHHIYLCKLPKKNPEILRVLKE